MIEFQKPKFQLGDYVWCNGGGAGYVTEARLESPPVRYHYFVSHFDEVGKHHAIGRGMLPEEWLMSDLEHREQMLADLRRETADVFDDRIYR